jgi:hypothetical protein
MNVALRHRRVAAAVDALDRQGVDPVGLHRGATVRLAIDDRHARDLPVNDGRAETVPDGTARSSGVPLS